MHVVGVLIDNPPVSYTMPLPTKHMDFSLPFPFGTCDNITNAGNCSLALPVQKTVIERVYEMVYEVVCGRVYCGGVLSSFTYTP